MDNGITFFRKRIPDFDPQVAGAEDIPVGILGSEQKGPIGPNKEKTYKKRLPDAETQGKVEAWDCQLRNMKLVGGLKNFSCPLQGQLEAVLAEGAMAP